MSFVYKNLANSCKDDKSSAKVHLITLSQKSWLQLYDDAVSCDKTTFKSTLSLLLRVEPTPNPINANINLRRRQCIFGAEYAFAVQKSKPVGGDDESKWPALVNFCLALAFFLSKNIDVTRFICEIFATFDLTSFTFV